MKKTIYLILVLVFVCFTLSFAASEDLLIDGYEVNISGGPDGTVDFGSGNGSTVEVSASKDILSSGSQSLKVDYDAVPGGYIWIARGSGLDAKNATWLRDPQGIDWVQYKAIAFYMHGNDSKAQVAFDVKDSGGEIWRFIVDDNFKGWKQVVCPFGSFSVRSDWQPDSADKNDKMDFPLKSYQFEPLPESKGTLYFDDVELLKK